MSDEVKIDERWTLETRALVAAAVDGPGCDHPGAETCEPWWVADRVLAALADTGLLAAPSAPSEPAAKISPEDLARRFHETYERLAPGFGYETRRASAKPWDEVPEKNRALMVAVCAELQTACRDRQEAVRIDDRELINLANRVRARHCEVGGSIDEYTLAVAMLNRLLADPAALSEPVPDSPRVETYDDAIRVLLAVPSHETHVAVDWLEARRDGREPELATTPRVWAMPPEPGPDVTRVRDVYGQCFERAEAYDGEGPPEPGWLGDTFTDEADVPDLFLTWKQLMKEHAPLTDVTSEVIEKPKCGPDPKIRDTHGEFAIEVFDLEPGNPDCFVVLLRNDEQVKHFTYPAYKIWTLLAHWMDCAEVNPPAEVVEEATP